MRDERIAKLTEAFILNGPEQGMIKHVWADQGVELTFFQDADPIATFFIYENGPICDEGLIDRTLGQAIKLITLF